jgi:hypothetical protein
MKSLESRIARARANSRALSTTGRTSVVTALTNERELVRVSAAIKSLQREVAISKTELAVLMGVSPDTEFELVSDADMQLPDELTLSSEDMITRAVRDRIELHEVWYQQRINKREANAALLELLPGLQAFVGGNINSNSYLLNADWISWGAKASWNLLKIFQYPAKSGVINHKDKVLEARALATTMSVMAQVHISRINYVQRQRELAAIADLRSVQERLMRQLRIEAEANLVSENVLLREELATLVAEAKYDIAFASLQAAYANVYATIGWNPFEDMNPKISLEEMSLFLGDRWRTVGHDIAPEIASLRGTRSHE